jgi:hypothetical protein
MIGLARNIPAIQKFFGKQIETRGFDRGGLDDQALCRCRSPAYMVSEIETGLAQNAARLGPLVERRQRSIPRKRTDRRSVFTALWASGSTGTSHKGLLEALFHVYFV